MTNYEILRERRYERPFRPFELTFKSGRKVTVWRPFEFGLARNFLLLGVAAPPEQVSFDMLTAIRDVVAREKRA